MSAPRRPIRSAFVTGGSGFVGRALLRRLAAEGVEVRALARSPRSAEVVAALGAEPVRGDLADPAALARGCAGADAVFHAAAKVDEWGPREAFDRINVEGTRHVIDAARAAGVDALVHVSTEAVLVDGSPLVQVDESRPLPARPIGEYPRTKGLAEQLVREATGLRAVVVRPRFVWGPDDTSVLPKLRAAVEEGRYAWIDEGAYLTSTCHVDNLCEGLWRAATAGPPGGVYFVTDGAPIRFRVFVERLLRANGLEPGSRSLPFAVARAAARASEALWGALPLPGEPPLTRTSVWLIDREVTVSDARIRRELGYRPVVARDAGLKALTG